jgi:hypothetical protein
MRVRTLLARAGGALIGTFRELLVLGCTFRFGPQTIYAQDRVEAPEEGFDPPGPGFVGFDDDGHREEVSRATPGERDDRELLVIHYLKDTNLHVYASIHQQQVSPLRHRSILPKAFRQKREKPPAAAAGGGF